MSAPPAIIGPWANWDDTLEGQEVYFAIAAYPDRKTATDELRSLLAEAGEVGLASGRAKKATIEVCQKDCEESCEYPGHQGPVEVWVYRPYAKPLRAPIDKQILRCSKCRLLVVASGRTSKAYIHGAWNGYKVDHCPGSKMVCLDPKKTARA